MTARHFIWPLFAAALFAFVPTQINAAPQVLALLETDAPTALTCDAGVCKAEFTTYCLQRERDIPDAATPYTVAEGRHLRLVLTSPNGGTRTVPAAPHLRIETARRGHTAVTLSMDAAKLSELGAIAAAIEIGGGVALAPVPVAGDPNPLTEADLALAIGPLRATGMATVDRAGGTVSTVWSLNKMINAVPPAAGKDRSQRASLWQRSLQTPLGQAAPDRVAAAKQDFDTCWNSRVVEVGAVSMRSCLQRKHDRLMWDNTVRYWKDVAAGS
ncbi:MAG: hypothetical protein OXT01_11545 [Rhodospirillaceae bacterium]|nr:hypothetical protein [Rhodospirillaceae bacterium]